MGKLEEATEGQGDAGRQSGTRGSFPSTSRSSEDSEEEGRMEYVRTVNFEAIEQSGPNERVEQALLDHASGATTCMVKCIKTPPGGGSPEGLHVHDVDQHFYVLRGTMSIEVDGRQYECGPGALVVFPAGVPHRNWNAGDQATVHLAINTPSPDHTRPFTRRV
jgi:quercetin dioxygenase-like cupin family protein